MSLRSDGEQFDPRLMPTTNRLTTVLIVQKGIRKKVEGCLVRATRLIMNTASHFQNPSLLRARYAVFAHYVTPPNYILVIPRRVEPFRSIESNIMIHHLQTNDSSTKNAAKKTIFYIDESLSVEDIILLTRLEARYEDEKWLRISSRFFDKTGKRFTPDEVRKCLQQS
jgi:hypothetical protein